MSGRVVPFSPGGPGRGPERVVALHDDLVEPWLEVGSLADEAADFADGVLTVARLILRALSRGNLASVAVHAESLELAAPRRSQQARQSAALARIRLADLEGIACPDAIAEPGHGRAA